MSPALEKSIRELNDLSHYSVGRLLSMFDFANHEPPVEILDLVCHLPAPDSHPEESPGLAWRGAHWKQALQAVLA